MQDGLVPPLDPQEASGIITGSEQILKEYALYVCPVENVLGRVPLMPCYLKGNLHNTIQHALRYEVPDGTAADSRHDSGTGSQLFEVNIWMWRYGRAFPRKISVEDLSGGC